MCDIECLTQLVLKERHARDRNWWARMRECFHEDSKVRLSWFRGTGAAFIDRSEAMAGRGTMSIHRLSPPVVLVSGNKAIVDMACAIEARTMLDDIEVDLTSFSRLVYRIERRSGVWKILRLDPIYERDTLASAMPGTPLSMESELLSIFRSSYRCLAYCLSKQGYDVDDDLYGDDRPKKVKALYLAAFAWAEMPIKV